MPKLNDNQLVILANAAKRPDGAILPVAKSLNLDQRATSKVLTPLLKKKFVCEVPAQNGAPAWRKDKDDRPIALSITSSGLQAIGIDPQDQAEPAAEGQAKAKTKTSQPRSRKGKKPAKPSSAAKTKRESSDEPQPRANTKQAIVIEMLRRAKGATIDELMDATSWQAHSLRGVMSGALKKKLKLDITSGKEDGRGRVYRIADRG